MSCHVGRLRSRRKSAKAAGFGAPGLGARAGPADLAGAPFGAERAGGAGLGSLGGLGAAVQGQGFPGNAGVAGLLGAAGVGQSDLAALAALGGLGGLGGLSGLGGLGGLAGAIAGSVGGFGGFPRGSPPALNNLAELSASHTTATMNKLVALNLQLRQQNAELQHCTMQLVRQLEREAGCAACQNSRAATNETANGTANGTAVGNPGPVPSRLDAAASTAEALERVATGSRVASLLNSLRGSESPTPLDVRPLRDGDGGADGGGGAPSGAPSAAPSARAPVAGTPDPASPSATPRAGSERALEAATDPGGKETQDAKRPKHVVEALRSVDQTDPDRGNPVGASRDGAEANGTSSDAKTVIAPEADARAAIGAKRKSPEPANDPRID